MRADLFVYGTLRRSEHAHALLGQDAVFLGEAVTVPSYTLYQLGWYPGLVEGGTTKITGEIWSIGIERWASLDEYEGVPGDYIRKKIALVGDKDAYTYIYVGTLHNALLLSGGDWMNRSQSHE